MSRFLASPPADAAIEIAQESVSIAVSGGRDTAVRGYAIEPLAPGAVAPSLTAHNLVDKRAVLAALRTAVDRVGLHPRRIALLVPDVAARVSLVRFERVPPRREDLEGLLRWQLRKSAPFPVDEALLTFVPGITTAEGEHEFIVVLARRDIVREYEGVCEDLGMQAGLVDLSTFGVINLLLASPAPAGDWLVVHVRPTYVSLVILRDGDVIFFRNVPDADVETLTDLVHQTTMYHQDRLSGAGFAQVLLGGVGRTAGSLDDSRRTLEARLGLRVQMVDPRSVASLADRQGATPEQLAPLAPAVGTLLRMQAHTAHV